MRACVPTLLRTAAIFVALLLLSTTNLSAATDAPGSFTSSQEIECARMLNYTGSGISDADRRILINPETCAAYRFLLERNGGGTRGVAGCYRSQADRIIKLNPQFAVGLYRALTEIERLYGGKNIIQSGYRCTPGNHSKGCAVDIIWRSCQVNPRPTPRGVSPWYCSSDLFDNPEQRWIDANGKQAPYNIHLRLRYAPEGHHVEPVNTQGCVTGAVVSSAAPSSGLSNMFRNALYGPQQPLLAQPVLPPQQALPSQPNLPQQPVLPSSQVSQYFSPNQSSASGSGTIPGKTSVDYYADLNPPSSQPSIADQLLMLAYGTTSYSQPVTHATTIPLFLGKEDTVSIQIVPTSTANVQQGVSDIFSYQVPQTFTSGGTGNSVPATFVQPSYTLRFVAVLGQLKDALARLLDILRPFGIRQSLQEETDGGHAE